MSGPWWQNSDSAISPPAIDWGKLIRDVFRPVSFDHGPQWLITSSQLDTLRDHGVFRDGVIDWSRLELVLWNPGTGRAIFKVLPEHKSGVEAP